MYDTGLNWGDFIELIMYFGSIMSHKLLRKYLGYGGN